jgi:formate dehydrogenase major subunit
VWWDAEKQQWTGHDVPDFIADRPPGYRPPAGTRGVDAISGIDPFIMQADGKAWLFAPAGLVDGPLPAHYEPQESPFKNMLYGQQCNPVRQVVTFAHPGNRLQPSGGEPGAEVFPYVATTYRLTEHHTAGGMSRWLPYLAELQPEFFCEVSPELAAERGLAPLGWATIVTARAAVEARVLVTGRMKTLTIQGRALHQVGLPYHWGTSGYSTGDSANDLAGLSLDPNVHIQEVKAFACDIRPGRRPRGQARMALVRDYQRRAGITDQTGMEA